MAAFPRDPLERFLRALRVLTEHRRWYEAKNLVRYAALPIVLLEGAPEQVAARVAADADRLAQDSGLFSAMRGSQRFVLAALIAAEGARAEGVAAACERIRELFRDEGVRRGGAFEALAALVLHLAGADGDRDIQRFKQIYVAMKQQHWWLTGPEDLPACALLLVSGTSPEAMSARMASIFDGLRDRGRPLGDALQTASNILFLADAPVPELLDRFTALHDGFKAQGVAMWQADYDELALLATLATDPQRLITAVLSNRERIRQEIGSADVLATFSFACGVAYLQALAGGPVSERARRDLRVANVVMAANVLARIQEQRSRS